MINNLEGMSKAELRQVIETQQAHDVERESEIKRLKTELEQADTLAENFEHLYKKQYKRAETAERQVKQLKYDLERKHNLFIQADDAHTRLTEQLLNETDKREAAERRIEELERENKEYELIVDKAREMLLDLDEMEQGSKEFLDLENALLDLFFPGDKEYSEVFAKYKIKEQIKALEEVRKRIASLQSKGVNGSYSAAKSVVTAEIKRLQINGVSDGV